MWPDKWPEKWPKSIEFPTRTVTEAELLERIDALNSDLGVDGIIVQMPLDCDAKYASREKHAIAIVNSWTVNYHTSSLG